MFILTKPYVLYYLCAVTPRGPGRPPGSAKHSVPSPTLPSETPTQLHPQRAQNGPRHWSAASSGRKSPKWNFDRTLFKHVCHVSTILIFKSSY